MTIKEKVNKIIKGDCIEEMKKMPENSIDTIITDLDIHIYRVL